MGASTSYAVAFPNDFCVFSGLGAGPMNLPCLCCTGDLAHSFGILEFLHTVRLSGRRDSGICREFGVP